MNNFSKISLLLFVPSCLVLRIWRVQAQSEMTHPLTINGDSIVVSSDGKFVAQDSNWIGQIIIYDRKTKRTRSYHPAITNDGDVGCKSMVPLGRTSVVAGLGSFFGTSSSSIGVYNLRSGNVRVVAKNQVIKRALASTPDGRSLIACARKGGIAFWDVQNGAEKRRWTQFGVGETAPDALTVSLDGKHLATGHYYMLYGNDAKRSGTDGGQSPQIWDLKTGRLTITCQKINWRQLPSKGALGWSTIDFTSLRFSPNGRFLATGSNGNGVAVWNAKTGKVVWALAHPQNRTGRSIVHQWNGSDVAFSPDSQRIAAPGNFGTIDVYSLRNGQLLQQIKGGGPLVWTKEGLFFKGLRRPQAEGLLTQVKI